MATTRNLFRYHVDSIVAVHGRRTLQKAPLAPWKFQFPADRGKVYVWDDIEGTEIGLHAGLKMIVVLEGTHSVDIQRIAMSLTDRILDTLSFTTLAQCDVPRLISHISINEDTTSFGTFFDHPAFDITVLNGTPTPVNEHAFNAVWKAFDLHPAKDRVTLSLQWFRKAIREKHTIDRFISYFTALEIANFTLRNILKQTGKKPREWAPATQVFESKVKSVGFAEVKQARNDILHGNRPISPDFTSTIRTYITPVTNAIVYLVGSILGLDDAVADTIAGNTTRRLVLHSALGLRGSFDNLPTDIKELLEHYPELTTVVQPNQYSMGDTGDLEVKASTQYTAELPLGTTFTADAAIARGQDRADMLGTSMALLMDE